MIHLLIVIDEQSIGEVQISDFDLIINNAISLLGFVVLPIEAHLLEIGRLKDLYSIVCFRQIRTCVHQVIEASLVIVHDEPTFLLLLLLLIA